MVRLVFMFPGQSSADPAMLRRAVAMHESACQILDRARVVIGGAAVDRYTGASGARLESNRDVQLAVFLTTQMHVTALGDEGVAAAASLGLSLGEYSHLVQIGALTFEAALALVDARGAAYDEAPGGQMVTVLGAAREQVEEAVAAARAHGTVVISNYNAPTQHVLAGHGPAVDRAAAHLEEEAGAHTIQTESRVPMHSPLLAPVAGRFRARLEAAPWQPVAGAYRPNVTGRLEAAATPHTFVERLCAHVTEPVRWQESIEAVHAEGPAHFVEVGPGEVLFNMLARRWLPVPRARTDDRGGSDPAAHFRTTLEEIRAHG